MFDDDDDARVCAADFVPWAMTLASLALERTLEAPQFCFPIIIFMIGRFCCNIVYDAFLSCWFQTLHGRGGMYISTQHVLLASIVLDAKLSVPDPFVLPTSVSWTYSGITG